MDRASGTLHMIMKYEMWLRSKTEKQHEITSLRNQILMLHHVVRIAGKLREEYTNMDNFRAVADCINILHVAQ